MCVRVFAVSQYIRASGGLRFGKRKHRAESVLLRAHAQQSVDLDTGLHCGTKASGAAIPPPLAPGLRSWLRGAGLMQSCSMRMTVW